MDKLRKALSGNDSSSVDEETGIIGQISESMTLSKTTRIKGFIILFVSGIFCSLLGSFCFFIGLGLGSFAIFYTLGNIVSLGSTCFLMGPVNQIKKMFAPTRAIATILVIVMFCLTLFAAFVAKKGLLVIIFVVLQSLAMTWYSLSYIPYARDVAKITVSSCIG
ncbi:Vesicle transport protein SFT2B, putative [Pediculus humanus corporis]|uniref:Vesicle transport protein n=1 Tax=Pediculus humanus subsp. corporis TaxID=121224 RepID=E0VKI0_PEDHC|nr:Vesicle transport protein SFT2B, putative [Pediculus humanus corporis]EEB13886.1 Vesicle transport protein SFT2B, putative [Pediculus humanus corporis]